MKPGQSLTRTASAAGKEPEPELRSVFKPSGSRSEVRHSQPAEAEARTRTFRQLSTLVQAWKVPAAEPGPGWERDGAGPDRTGRIKRVAASPGG